MPSVNPSSLGGPKPQFVDATGAPAAGYQLFFYAAGSVATKQDTFTDSTGNTTNTNPIVLDMLGEPPTEIWFQSGLAYHVLFCPPTDTDPPTSPLWDVDNLRGINDTSVTIDQWIIFGQTPTFISGTSFSLNGDQSSNFKTGRRVKIVDGVGTKYGTIVSGIYDGVSLTTVTVTNDGAALVSPLAFVSYGLLSPDNVSIPQYIVSGSGITISYAAGIPTISAVAPIIARDYLAGCIMSTAGASATMSIAAGLAVDSTNANYMALAAIAKTTAAWVVGTAVGGLDTGAIANNTFYHFYVIKRLDTNVVDVVFSLSATAPTLPANYTVYRRIGACKTDGSAQWTAFIQDGNTFNLSTPIADISSGANPGIAAITRTLASVPAGLNLLAFVQFTVQNSGTGGNAYGLLSDLAMADVTPTVTRTDTGGVANASGADASQTALKSVRTNTSSQIRARLAFSDGNVAYTIVTLGWLDSRGQNA